jgi:RNase P subunit RPR2
MVEENMEKELESTLCYDCNQPLFLSKEECLSFIENRMKQGYIVCSCCGSQQKVLSEND